jgi:hypothetical protein
MVEGMIRRQRAEDRGQKFCRDYAAQSSKVCRVAAYGILSSAFCLLSSVLCYAEELTDPTRPPAAIVIPATATAGSRSSGLQSVIISKNRRAAIIDGETIELRGKHGDATLIEVTESGVVLQGAQGRQVLTLFPGVRMMQKDIQAAPKLPVEEGEVAQKTKLEASKERK